MRWRSLYLKVLSLWFTIAPLCGWAQIQGKSHAFAGVDVSGNAETVEAALRQMSDHAAIIFVGTVAGIRRSDSTGFGGGTVEVQFVVEQPIRGCSAGTYTLREWGGFWTANDSRYRIGQRLLLLLHAPGAAGLSSPVGGMDGAIPVRASGAGVKGSDASVATAEQVADLRWIGAKLARKVAYATSGPVATALARSSSTGSASAQSSSEVLSGASSSASAPAQEAAVSTVVTMIKGWEVQTNATR